MDTVSNFTRYFRAARPPAPRESLISTMTVPTSPYPHNPQVEPAPRKHSSGSMLKARGGAATRPVVPPVDVAAASETRSQAEDSGSVGEFSAFSVDLSVCLAGTLSQGLSIIFHLCAHISHPGKLTALD